MNGEYIENISILQFLRVLPDPIEYIEVLKKKLGCYSGFFFQLKNFLEIKTTSESLHKLQTTKIP